jgi:hypothetical protein
MSNISRRAKENFKVNVRQIEGWPFARYIRLLKPKSSLIRNTTAIAVIPSVCTINIVTMTSSGGSSAGLSKPFATKPSSIKRPAGNAATVNGK